MAVSPAAITSIANGDLRGSLGGQPYTLLEARRSGAATEALARAEAAAYDSAAWRAMHARGCTVSRFKLLVGCRSRGDAGPRQNGLSRVPYRHSRPAGRCCRPGHLRHTGSYERYYGVRA